MENNLRQDLYAFIKDTYGLLPEHPFAKRPDDAVFQHTDNLNVFAIFKDTLEVKMPDIMLADMLARQSGISRSPNASRRNWLSIRLDGTVPYDQITQLITESFLATASSKTKQAMRPPKEWVIPSNPKYYDIVDAFQHNKEIQWKQGRGIKAGDTVFMYVGVPYSAILYKCLVTKTNIPWKYREGNLKIIELMNIRLVKTYAKDQFPLSLLSSEYGVVTVRGPRGIPKNLSDALNA